MREIRKNSLYCVLLLSIVPVFIFIPIKAVSTIPWDRQSVGWYYDNLTSNDRKLIRQAIDYCIPREKIIEELYLGNAAVISSPIGVNSKDIYEHTIEPRIYNSTKALELLTEVFGLKYDTDASGTNMTHTNTPYFSLTIVVPIINDLITNQAFMISDSLNDVGIDTTLKFWDWNIIIPRLFINPVAIGFDYNHGGYDMALVGCNTSPDPEYKNYYDKESFPPSSNWYWIEDGPPTSGIWVNNAYPNVTTLWEDIYREPNQAKRATLLKEYQQWCYDEVPTSIICQEMGVFGMNKYVAGFNLYHGFKQNLANLTIGNDATADIAQPGEYVDFNPLLSNSYYDAIIHENIFVKLSRRRGEYNLSHAVPWLTESWTHTDNYLEWNVKLREGVRWSDGTELTADDVVFTYHAALNASTGYPGRGRLLSIIRNTTGSNGEFKAVQKVNDYEVRFTLPSFYPYVETILFDVPILQKAQMNQIPLKHWRTDDTNTKYTPIGAGAYMFDQHKSKLPNIVVVKSNPYYNETLMGHNPNLVSGGNWLPNPTLTEVTFHVVKDANVAVSGLTSGLYDIIDYHTGIQAFANEIASSDYGKILRNYEWGYQEIGINHYNPIFGMNPHDPRKMYPPEGVSEKSPYDINVIFLSLLVLIFYKSLKAERRRSRFDYNRKN